MKNLIFFLIFSIYAFASSSFFASKSLYFKDLNSNLTFEQVKKEKFIKTKSDNFGFKTYPIWKKFKLKNEINSNQILYAINYKPVLDYVDIYILRKDKSIDKFLIGDKRKQNKDFIKSRFLLFEVALNPKEEVEIYISHKNTKAAVYTDWKIHDKEEISQTVYYDSLFYGIFIGIAFILFIKSLILYFSLRQNFLLYYGFVVISAILGLITLNGLIYSFDIGIPLELISKPELGFFFFLFFIILFHYDFFEIKFENKKSRWFIKSLLVIPVSFLLVDVLFPDEKIPFLIPLFLIAHWFVIISLLIMGIKMSLKGVEGGWFYVLGQSFSFITSVYVFSYLIITASNPPIWIFYFSFIGYFGNVLALSIALFLRIKKQQEQLKIKSDVLLELSKFHNSEMAVNNIIHQWKIPLARIIVILTDIQAQVYLKKPVGNILENDLPEINKNAMLLAKIVHEFYNFNQKNEKSSFLYKEELDEILKMLGSKIIETKALINFNVEDNSKMLNINKFAITNTTTILINNFLDIAIKRNIKQAVLNISLSKDSSNYKITFEDSCGGIDSIIIDKLFEPFESISNDKARGLGLYIAKTLVEEKLEGSIKAHNTKNGAIFEITYK